MQLAFVNGLWFLTICLHEHHKNLMSNTAILSNVYILILIFRPSLEFLLTPPLPVRTEGEDAEAGGTYEPVVRRAGCEVSRLRMPNLLPSQRSLGVIPTTMRSDGPLAAVVGRGS